MLNLRSALPDITTHRRPMFRAGVRGLVAAMAMTGLRRVTANTRLVRTPPPAAIVEHAPQHVQQMRPERRQALTELAHWTYGTVGGSVFGLLPARLRAHPAAGPLYGLVFWLGFELGIAPLLGESHVRDAPLLGRVLVAVDHVLYGVMVGGRLAAEPGNVPPPRSPLNPRRVWSH